MKNIKTLIATILVATLSINFAAYAASTPPSYEQRVKQNERNTDVQSEETNDTNATESKRPERPVVDTGRQNVKYSLPTRISFIKQNVTIDMSEYDNNNPYKAYYIIETDVYGDPLLSIGNMCDNGYQIYGMTDEEDAKGRYIAIYPYKEGIDRLMLSSQKDEDINDILTITIVNQKDSDMRIIKEDEYVDSNEEKTYEIKETKPVIDEPKQNVEIESNDNNVEENEEEDAFSDVDTDNKYYVPILALKKANVITGYPDGTFRPYSLITRAEVCTIIINMIEDLNVSTSNKYFKDTKNHWASESIMKCRYMGIVNGYDENTFGPDDNITDEQIIKILVCLIGYGENAPYIGGYPNGYIEIAEGIGLLKSVSYKVGHQTNRGTLSQMIYNAFHITNKSGYEFVSLTDNKTINSSSRQQTKNMSNNISTDKKSDKSIDKSVYNTVIESISYITSYEAEVITEFLEKCIKQGWKNTDTSVSEIAERYPEEALLEEISDIYNKLR